MSTMTAYKGFGNGQTVDITKYKGREKEAQENTKRGKFVCFGFLDLSKYYLPMANLISYIPIYSTSLFEKSRIRIMLIREYQETTRERDGLMFPCLYR